MLQIGSFPFLFKKGKLHIMLIMNSARRQWILPKGNPEHHLKHYEVAEMETLEEAGVTGKIVDKKLYKEFETAEGNTLRIYPLHIDTILDKWPEDYFRKRELLKVEQALDRINREEYIKAIKYFSSPDKSPLFDKHLKKKHPELIPKT